MTLEEAKKMFLNCFGSHFNLLRELGELGFIEYKKVNILKETEFEWLKLYIKDVQTKLLVESDEEMLDKLMFAYQEIVCNYPISDWLLFMINYVKEVQDKLLNPIVKMRMIEKLMKAGVNFKDEKLIKEAKQIALKSFQKLLKETKEFKQENYPFYTKEKFVNRINNDIKKYKL